MPAGVVGDFVLVEPYGDYASTTTATTGSHGQFKKYVNKVDIMEPDDAAQGSFFKDGGLRTDQETCHGTPEITITVRVVSRFCAGLFCFPPVLSPFCSFGFLHLWWMRTGTKGLSTKPEMESEPRHVNS